MDTLDSGVSGQFTVWSLPASEIVQAILSLAFHRASELMLCKMPSLLHLSGTAIKSTFLQGHTSASFRRYLHICVTL